MSFMSGFNKITLIAAVAALWILSVVAAARFLGKFPQTTIEKNKIEQTQTVIEEESAVISVVEKVSPSVVSIAIENRQLFDPFFGLPQRRDGESGIGTGFVVGADGLVITNKH